MKVATVVGVLLIVVGFAGFAFGGISFTHEKKDIDLGPLQVSHKEKSPAYFADSQRSISHRGRYLVVVGVRSR